MSPNLKLVVDPDTGEVLGHEVDEVRKLREELDRSADVIAGLQRDIRGWAIRYRELERDKGAEAREHDLWPVGRRIFRQWRTSCRHPRSAWMPDRFWLIEPFLTQPKYGQTLDDRVALCLRAVAGAAFDPYVSQRRNGSLKRHDDFELIFRSSGKFEEFCNRAPQGWTP